MTESTTAVALVTGEVRGQYPTARPSIKAESRFWIARRHTSYARNVKTCFEFNEELGQFSLPVGLRLLEHALQMHAHSRKPDTQLGGHKLQAMAFQHKKSDPGLGLRQIEDVAEVGWLQLRAHIRGRLLKPALRRPCFLRRRDSFEPAALGSYTTAGRNFWRLRGDFRIAAPVRCRSEPDE